MKKVYFAGPMFCKSEKDYNAAVAAMLEDAGYSVFLPQRDGNEAALMKDETEEERTRVIFDVDTAAIRNADVLFMVLDGRVPDEGACVELGIAYALGKPCYGIKTDVRAAENGMDLNPLIAGCFKRIFRNPDGAAALRELAEYLKTTGL